MNRPKHDLYLCDPKKNTECDKKYCSFFSDSKVAICNSTFHPEYAQLDAKGRPIPFQFRKVKRQEKE